MLFLVISTPAPNRPSTVTEAGLCFPISSNTEPNEKTAPGSTLALPGATASFVPSYTVNAPATRGKARTNNVPAVVENESTRSG